MTVDVQLARGANKIYDCVIASNGDLATVDSFNTSLAVSLFGEKRANVSEVPQASRRRGWWGNETNDEIAFELGSKLWIVMAQPRKTTLNLNRAKSYAEDCLKWLVEDGFLQRVEVAASFTEIGLRLKIDLYRSQDIIETRYYDLWNNSGELVT